MIKFEKDGPFLKKWIRKNIYMISDPECAKPRGRPTCRCPRSRSAKLWSCVGQRTAAQEHDHRREQRVELCVRGYDGIFFLNLLF